MKVLYISIATILIITTGMFFVFGDKILQVYDSEKTAENNINSENIGDSGEIELAGSSVGETTGGGESSGADGSNEGEVTEEIDCKTQQIQYSLKNLEENVECTDTGANGCAKLIVNCSMEIYNLDREINGDFAIRYSLVDSNNEELDFKLIQKNVEFGAPEIFSANFIISDTSGVDENSSCPFTVEIVPKKEICN